MMLLMQLTFQACGSHFLHNASYSIIRQSRWESQ